jgi:N,N'-diacetyllegionaminate synthase
MLKTTLIIAEAGVNHNGDINLAYELIDAAKKAGADIVKFQSFKASASISKSAKKAEYQNHHTDPSESQYEMIKRLELSKENHLALIEKCEKVGIEFLSSPFDLVSIHLLHKLGTSYFKIPSGEITNYPYLKALAEYNKQVIMSTGMATLVEIGEALEVLTTNGTDRENITILHCNTEYPTPFKDVNLKAMLTIQQAFKLPVGYSDHTTGIEIPIAAVAMGATIVEKHFTLDRTLSGPDHKASLEPHELKAMVDSIRNIELAMGDGVKQPSPSEVKNISVARKSIVASRDICKGEIFSEDNITTKRPGYGISPMEWNNILGSIAIKAFKKDEEIQ